MPSRGVDFILISRLESDDMYHKEMIADIQKQEIKGRSAIIVPKGYLLCHAKVSILKRLKWKLGKIISKYYVVQKIKEKKTL